jgi:hypothetical protein
MFSKQTRGLLNNMNTGYPNLKYLVTVFEEEQINSSIKT